jgi:hypothetical protein
MRNEPKYKLVIIKNHVTKSMPANRIQTNMVQTAPSLNFLNMAEKVRSLNEQHGGLCGKINL